jgi:4-hydroxy-tetrahydrodipicolinate reductase
MKIGIIGYGKMGKAVEAQALRRGHTVCILPHKDLTRSEKFAGIDCAVDFSHASVAPGAVRDCLLAGKRVVSGTTGWNQQLEMVKTLCRTDHSALCWSPNFSVGMNILFYINGVLADIMNQFEGYTPRLLEIHHATKKDAPSGTAIAMADQVVNRIERTKKWELKSDQPESQHILTIDARREDEDVKGIHRMTYESEQDTISLRHHALSRDGFALGAVIAAEWLEGKTGFFTFEDVLNFTARP